MIYFVQDTETRAIKIGYSADPKKRFQQLQCATSHRLATLGTAPGDKAKERALHLQLRPWHVRGEWFADCPEVRRAMDLVLHPYPVIGGRTIRSVYLAGKISKHGWRESIVSDLNFADGDQPENWPVRRSVIVLRGGRTLDYTGPFFVSDDHGCAHRLGHAYASEEIACQADGGWRVEVPRLCLDAVRRADLLFAWIDSEDCHGTLAEIGFARAIEKAILIAGPVMFPDLWFTYSLADRIRFGVETNAGQSFQEMTVGGKGHPFTDMVVEGEEPSDWDRCIYGFEFN